MIKKHTGDVVQVVRDGKSLNLLISVMDDQTLAKSRRILMLHTTGAKNSGAVFSDQKRSRVNHWDKGPALIRQGSAHITLQLDVAHQSLEV